MQNIIRIIYGLKKVSKYIQINATCAWDKISMIIFKRRISYSVKYNGSNACTYCEKFKCYFVNEMLRKAWNKYMKAEYDFTCILHGYFVIYN